MTFKKFVEEENKFIVFVDLDGCIVDFERGIKESFEKYKHKKESLMDIDIDWSSTEIEKQIEKHLLDNGEKSKVARAKAGAYFWGIPHGFMRYGKKATDEEREEKRKRTLAFWENLHPLPDKKGGLKLWDHLLQLKSQGKISTIKILSSPSNDPECEIGKRNWVKKHLKDISDENVIIKKEKWQEATGPYDILIDDTPKKLVGNEKVPGWATEGGTPIHHKNFQGTIDSLKSILEMSEEKLVMRSQKVVGKMRNLSDVYVILDDSSRSLLGMKPGTFDNNYSTEKDGETFDHHVTIYYKPTIKQWEHIQNLELLEGDEISVSVNGLYYSEDIGAEAFTVDISKVGNKLEFKDRILHITHSLKDGVEAKDSNVMLRSSSKVERDMTKVTLKGKIKLVPIK